MRRTLISIAIFALLMFPIACGPKPASGWTTFSNPNYIYDMLLVDDHTFWVAGPGGVAQYDSRSGKTIHYTHKDGLPGTFYSYRLRRAPDGSILAVGKRVYRFDGKFWHPESILPADPEIWQIFDIQFASDGTPWMTGRYVPDWAAGETIYRYDGKTWQKMLAGGPELRLALSQDGKTIWTASWEDINYYQNDTWKKLSYPFEPSMGISLYDFVADVQGHLWVTIGGTGKSSTLYHFDGSQWTAVELELSLGNIWTDPTEGIWYTVQKYGTPPDSVILVHRVGVQVKETLTLPFDDVSIYSFNTFVKASDGSLWLGGDGENRWTDSGQPGFYHYADGVWTRSLLDADVPYLSYGSCVVDKKGQVYFLSQGNVLRWDGRSWSVFNKPNSLYLSDLKELDGTLWAHDKNVYRLESEQWTPVFKAPNNEPISHYALSPDQTLWVAWYASAKIWVSNGVQTQQVPLEKTSTWDEVKGLDIDQEGNIYLATQYRLYQWDGVDWQMLKDFGKALQSFALIDDQPWVTVYGTDTMTEVYYLEGAEWKLVQGLNLDPQLNIGETITGMYATNQAKVIWLTTGPGLGRGVIRYDRAQKTSVRITTEDGLANDTTSAVCEDKMGAIWFATWGGISRYIQ